MEYDDEPPDFTTDRIFHEQPSVSQLPKKGYVVYCHASRFEGWPVGRACIRNTSPPPGTPSSYIDYMCIAATIMPQHHALYYALHSPIYNICYCIQSPCTHDVMTCTLRFCGSPNGQGAVNHRAPRNVIQLQPQNRPCLCLLRLLPVCLPACLPSTRQIYDTHPAMGAF